MKLSPTKDRQLGLFRPL